MSTQLKTQELFKESLDIAHEEVDLANHSKVRNEPSFGTAIIAMLVTFGLTFGAIYFYPTLTAKSSPKPNGKQVGMWESAMSFLGVDTDPRKKHKTYMNDLKFEMERASKRQQRDWDSQFD
jgi:hypothetical protein